MKQIKFEDVTVGLRVYDKDFKCHGIVKDCSDIHNVHVEYEGGGSGLYCMKTPCDVDIFYTDTLYVAD